MKLSILRSNCCWISMKRCSHFSRKMVEFLSKVGSGIVATLGCACSHASTIESAKSEEWLAVRMKRGLFVAELEVDTSKCLGSASISELIFDDPHRPEPKANDDVDRELVDG